MNISWKKAGLCLASIGFLASCESNTEKKDQEVAEKANPGIETQYMDMDVNPKDDFFRFVNGTWLKETEIPADRTSWGGFQILRQETDKNVLQLLEEGRQNQDFKEGSVSEAALVTSGTATLETALFNVPEVVCYKGNFISYHIAKRIIQLNYISLVNLIMDREVVKELIQDEFNEKQLRLELEKILSEKNRNKILNDYQLLKQKLGGEGASEKTAKLIVSSFK